MPAESTDGLSRMRARIEQFWQELDGEFGLLDHAGAAQALNGFAGEPARLHEKGALLAVDRHGNLRYPGFQFEGGRSRAMISDLITLGRRYDLSDADIVMWLCVPTTYLRQEDRPVDHLANEPDLVLKIAAAAWGVEW